MTGPKSRHARDKLLEAAADVFAEKGFRNARVREICARSGANVAAVNYHFGDKESLYNEVLRDSFFRITGADPMEKLSAANASPGRRISLFVEVLLIQLLSEGRAAQSIRLLTRELADPTPALERVIDEGIRPQIDFLLDAVGDLMGPRASKREIRRGAGSILGQCLYYQFAGPVIRHLGLEEGLDASAAAEIAKHITEFSLAGLERIGRAPGGP